MSPSELLYVSIITLSIYVTLASGNHCDKLVWSRRFYIGCDLCSNWFHGACVGITEKEAKKLEDFVCSDCKRGQEGGSGSSSSEELYCICRTPYDESQYGFLHATFL